MDWAVLVDSGYRCSHGPLAARSSHEVVKKGLVAITVRVERSPGKKGRILKETGKIFSSAQTKVQSNYLTLPEEIIVRHPADECDASASMIIPQPGYLSLEDIAQDSGAFHRCGSQNEGAARLIIRCFRRFQ